MLSSDGKAKADTHGAKSARVEPLQWFGILQNRAANIHRVRTLRYDDVVVAIACDLVLNDTDRGVIVHGEALVLSELGRSQGILIGLALDARNPSRGIGATLLELSSTVGHSLI